MTAPGLPITSIPRFIYFAGVDGSGKSTYVDLITKEFEKIADHIEEALHA